MKPNKPNIPDAYKDIETWETNRRSFLRAALIAGAASQIAWFTSCSRELEKGNEHLSPEQSTILKDMLMIIFPNDGNGPSADDLNSFGYIMWVLSDTYREKDENEFIVEGIDWSNKKAKEIYGDNFYELTDKEQKTLVAQFVEMDWGKTWMSVMVTHVLESAVLDPIYGGNVDEAGWNWLNHVPGLPRPTEETRFEAFINKYKPQDA
ncbi:MAG: gluconate 2-dehydrogenase subunit 3 family protein [Crocinitomicaceae bacterium]|nr:gluconate 2-dehydrogenase subunit 3 family protein [Crocinitomicaceae bacterium]